MLNFALILVTLVLCSCARFSARDPAAQFVSTYKLAFDSADTNALLALVKWDGMPDDLRAGMVWKLTSNLGVQRVSLTELLPFDNGATIPPNKDGRKLIANLPPKFWLHVITESISPASYEHTFTSKQFLMGVEDSKYYICGFRFAEP